MPGSHVTFADWRAKVEQELAGKPFEKALVHETLEGVSIAPLYIEAPRSLNRDASNAPFRICMRHEAGATEAQLLADLEEGADAVWVPWGTKVPGAGFVIRDVTSAALTEPLDQRATAYNFDPIAARIRGAAAFDTIDEELAQLGPFARRVGTGSTAVMVSTLPAHEAGAHGVDELAIALTTGALYLDAMIVSGLTADEAAATLALQVSAGRDTFLELCKLRALRTCWSKVLAAFGVKAAPRTVVHAVCSSRTMTGYDPWVNMLRVTTQVFAAVLGGADLVTPNAFDQALGTASALGRRVARNTGLVLREESQLGKVADPAAGSYALETLTDALARKAWQQFREIEQGGGIVAALRTGRLAAELEGTRKKRFEAISRRREPILGVSEFANLDEPAPSIDLSGNRDASTFEVIRAKAAAQKEVLLVTLDDARARVGFASSFFAAGGLRSRETAHIERAPIACVCGSDARYATHAADLIRALKAAGCAKVLVAGRPGALEQPLRDAGADGFIFMGCDAVSTLFDLVASPS